MVNKIGTLALAMILARPSAMNTMDDEKVIAAADSAVNTPVENFFIEQINNAAVSIEKSALAQLALINRKELKRAA